MADYLDGALAAHDREHDREGLLGHLNSCPECAALLADAETALAFIERAADVDPSPALTSRILKSTSGSWTLKLRNGGVRGWINRAFAPVLQPRLVFGAMLTLMSVALVTHGVLASLDPARVWASVDDRTHRVWYRAVKNYESMPLVYDVRLQIDDWQRQQQESDEDRADSLRR